MMCLAKDWIVIYDIYNMHNIQYLISCGSYIISNYIYYISNIAGYSIYMLLYCWIVTPKMSALWVVDL